MNTIITTNFYSKPEKVAYYTYNKQPNKNIKSIPIFAIHFSISFFMINKPTIFCFNIF